MRRRLLALTAGACLCTAAGAYAAGPITSGPNTYTGNFSVSGAAGSAAKPAAVAMTETLGMGSATAGNIGAPLVEIRTTTYGVKAPNAKYFPKCTADQINGNNGNNGQWNAVCPKGSLVASGKTDALLGPASLQGPGTPCSLDLSVYNAGPGKLTFFFTIPTSGPGCAGLATGAAAAWTGSVSESGKNLVTDVPEPADVSYNAGNTGLFGSLVDETLNFKRVSVKHAGKVLPFLESTGCMRHTRPFTITYTPTESNSGSPTLAPGTVKGAAGC